MASAQRTPNVSKVVSSNNHHHHDSSASNYDAMDCIITYTDNNAAEVSGGIGSWLYCTLAALCCLGAIVMVAASVRLRVAAVDDKIAYTHGLFILAMGFVFFVALTHFWQHLLQRTLAGRAFCGRYRLLRSDALEITNKWVYTYSTCVVCVFGVQMLSE